MFNIFGKYINFKNDIKNTLDSTETFTNSQVFGVGETPNIDDIDIQNAKEKLKNNYDNEEEELIESLKIGSLFHKKIRQIIRPILKPGTKLSEISNLIESSCMELTGKRGTNYGIGFPPSLSVNNCIAHFNPSSEFDKTLDDNSVIKIDFGVNVNEWITDCAFTIGFNENYINLMEAAKETTNHGIKTIGIDGNIMDWGSELNEIMESYELTDPITGNNINIKTIKNLGGHNIIKGHIHGGSFLPAYGSPTSNERFKKNLYAVETFGSTGSEYARINNNENTIYMSKMTQSDYKNNRKNIPSEYIKLYDVIYSNFKMMSLCDKYLDNYNMFSEFRNMKGKKWLKNSMDYFNRKNYIKKYPPLYCPKNGFSAQYEHNVYISEDKKIIFTQDQDY